MTDQNLTAKEAAVLAALRANWESTSRYDDGRVLSNAMTYIEGLALFLRLLMRGLQANRLEDRSAA